MSSPYDMKSSTKHQPKYKDSVQDEYIFGNSRGGGGSPLRNTSGVQISKLGTIINGTAEVDRNKYDSAQRPSTSFHQPRSQDASIQWHSQQQSTSSSSCDFSPSSTSSSNIAQSRIHRDFNIVSGQATPQTAPSSGTKTISRIKEELFAPVMSIGATSASVSSTGIRNKGRQHTVNRDQSDYFNAPYQYQQGQEEEGDEDEAIASHGHSHSHHQEAEEDSKLPGIVGGGAGGSEAVGIKSGVRGMKDETNPQKGRTQPNRHLFNSGGGSKGRSAQVPADAHDDMSSELLSGQRDILMELNSIKAAMMRQTCLESVRYALTQLSNPAIVKEEMCSGMVNGVYFEDIPLQNVVQTVLLQFMKDLPCQFGANMQLQRKVIDRENATGGQKSRGGHHNGTSSTMAIMMGGSSGGEGKKALEGERTRAISGKSVNSSVNGGNAYVSFRDILCETLWTLTGSQPGLSVLHNGEYEICFSS